MKLYFYTLRENEIQFKEWEAEEERNSYYVKNCIGNIYSTRIKKEQIGKIVDCFLNKTVVLTEKDDERAKEILTGYIQKKIENHEKEIERLKKTINAIQEWSGNYD